jgi:hypothetical protein
MGGAQTKTTLFFVLFPGWQLVLNRIPYVRGIDLAEAHELVKHDFAAIVSYPLRHTGKKRTSDEQDDEPGGSEKPEPSKKKQKTEGKIVPTDDPANRKYGSRNIPPLVKNLITQHLKKRGLLKHDKHLSKECVNLISNSLAKRTWEKYNSALSLWKKFETETDAKHFSRIAFVCWCSRNTKLKPDTGKGYLSALKKLKFLLGFERKKIAALEKILLRGMENIRLCSSEKQKQVTPVDLLTLVNIKKGMDCAKISSASEKAIWSLSLTAFWGLLRLGEILPQKSDQFDKTSVLLWQDVKLTKDKVVLRIKLPKTRSSQSRTVVLYKLPDPFFCPVRHLNDLEKIQKEKNLWGQGLPVLRRDSGKALTKTSFLEGINKALEFAGKGNVKLQGKSFRSGIPSLLGSSEDESLGKNLKKLGRWKGLAYHCYIRNQDPVSQEMFTKIARKLLKNFLCREKGKETPPDPGEQ